MNTMGCSILLMAAIALVVGFIPILTWINIAVALPLALVAVAISGLNLRKQYAQQADKVMFWMSVALVATIILRSVAL